MKYLTYIRTITVTFILTAATLLPTVAQTTRRVTEGGTGDGNTWATASSLQAALTASTMTGDQIWIAAGTYKPHPTDKTVTFSIPAGVLVYGGFDGTEDALADRAGGATILSGDLSDNDPARGEADYEAMRTDNSKTVVTIAGANTTLDGLTIKGGEEGTSFNEFRSDGAGLFASTGTAGIVLRNCSFTNNNVEHSASSFGGGAYFAESATLTNCTFIDNTATSDGGGAYFNVDATLTNCVFASNTANRGGGAWFRSGGTVINSTFYNNTATLRGGGIYLIFEDTDTRAVGIQTSPFTLQNSILVGNTATTAGPQVYVNNTLTSDVNIQTNLIEGGADPDGTDQGIRYFISIGDITEEGTVDAAAAAVFASTDADNAEYLRLAASGPAVNAGNNTYASGITTDAAGEARIQDGTVDLGAYESGIKAAQQIIFSAPADNVIGAVGDVITLGAQSQTLVPSLTGLFASFAIDPPTGLATLTDNGDGTGTIRLDAPGTVVVTASQTGDATYAPATDVTRTITVRPTTPTIFRVTETGARTGSGSDWDNATTLQAALAASTVTGDQLWIKAGTYTPSTVLDSNNPTDEEREATFTIPEGVKLYGGFAGTEITFDPTTTIGDTRPRSEGVLTSVTTLSGDLLDDDILRSEADYEAKRADNSYTVVTINGINATLDGLTITAGEGGTPFLNFGVVAERQGAGLFADVGTPGLKLINCIFSGNNITSTVLDKLQGGAALFNDEATVNGCAFIDNTAVVGGAVYIRGSDADVKFANCTFMGNTAKSGGAVLELSSNGGTFENCLFSNNRATVSHGGGLRSDSPSLLTNTVFYNNTANTEGGGVYFPNGGTVINSTFYSNTSNTRGGGIYFGTSATTPSTLRNSLLIGNTATDNASGHQVYVNNTTATNEVNLQNNLIAGGADPMGTDQGAVYANTGAGGLMQANTVDASDVATVFASIMADEEDFLRLAMGSPAANAGNNEYLKNDTPANTDDDITTDLAGRPRIVDGTVDLGAYESKAVQTIDFTLVASGTVGTEITLPPTTSAGLPVTYTSSAPAVAAVVDVAGTPTLRLLTLGTATITASNGGNDTYAAADVTQDITIRAPTVFRVTEGGDMAADGSAWATATTLNNALGMAAVGDQVWIATGEYKPGTILDSDAPTDEERTATFTIPPGVLVYGGFAGTEATFDPTTTIGDTRPRDGEGVLTSVTTLSGDLLGGDLARPVPPANAKNPTPGETAALAAYNDSRADNSLMVVHITGANTTLDGLTITAGHGKNTPGNFDGGGLFAGDGTTGTTLVNCTFTENEASNNGGGAHFRAAEATLTGCTFTNNEADNNGGGVYFSHTSTLTDCTFTDNETSSNGGGAYCAEMVMMTGSNFSGNTSKRNNPNVGGGGGCYVLTGSATLTNCTFTNNETTGNGSGGGALFNTPTTLTNCTFMSNVSARDAGGTFFATRTTLTDCSFISNTANTSTGGGAVFRGSPAILTNCTFTGNRAINAVGGGANFNAGTTTLTNCTFTDNTANINGGGANCSGSNTTLRNCVFANNTATSNGGGLCLNDGGTVINTTLYSNTATNSNGGGICVAYISRSNFNLQNSLLVGNRASEGNQVFINNTNATNNRESIQYNLLESSTGIGYMNPGAASIMEANTLTEADEAVVFASTDVADEDNYLRLKEGSPAVNAGNDDFLNNGTPDDTDDDLTTDITGTDARIQQFRVDLGAYESTFKGVQTIDFTLVAVAPVGDDIALTATSSAGLPVSYDSSEPAIAEVVDNNGTPTLRLVAAGTVTITASQSGDDTYAMATPVVQTIRVRALVIRRVTTAGDATADGDTWATATTLNNALGISMIGDQIWVKAGEYKPTTLAGMTATEDEQAMTFTIPAGARVYGGFAGDEAPDFNPATTARTGAATILSGDLLDDDIDDPSISGYIASREDNSNTVVTVAGADVILDGLTIKSGAGGTEWVSPSDGTTSRYGGGLYAVIGTATSTIVTNCTFINCTSENGGGAYFEKNATVTDCIFRLNDADSGNGGGAYFLAGATVTGCTFSSTAARGGGAYFLGDATVTGCTFTNSVAKFFGGGAFFAGTATLTNCVVAGNSTTTGGSGGGLFFGAGGTVINSTFYNNTPGGAGQGGGILVSFTDTDPDMAGVQINPFNLRNSLLVGSTIYLAYEAPLSVTAIEAVVDYNLIGGGMADLGVGLFDGGTYTDGLLANATNVALTNTVEESDATMVFASTTAMDANYLRLAAGSPAANAGNNDYVNNATPPVTTDAAGDTRIQVGTVDLGAYESDIKVAQTIDFTLVDTAPVGDEITLAATSSAGLAVSYAITELLPDGSAAATGAVATLAGGVLTLVGAGTATITASQSGNDTYAAATDVMQTITVRTPVIRRITMTGDAAADGGTWATATTLNTALGMAAIGDQFWIKGGTYKPDATDRAVTFTIPAGVRVYGGFVGDEADDFNPATTARTGAATILSGDLLGDDIARPAAAADQTAYDASRDDNSNVVVTVTEANVVLDGLTITAGQRAESGAGLFSTGANTAVTNCAFTNNTASSVGNGGGAYFNAAGITLTGCTFTGNVGHIGGGAYFGRDYEAKVTGCTFTDNVAGFFGGGGAAFSGVATLTDCTFTDNETSGRRGGGATFDEPATVTNTVFTGNSTSGNGGGAHFIEEATLTNCVFANNYARDNSGGIQLSGGGTVINSTFYNNTTEGSGGGILAVARHFPFVLRNSLLIGNMTTGAASGHQVHVFNDHANVIVVNIQNNLIAGGTTGTGAGIIYEMASSAGITEASTVDASDAAVVFASTMASEANYLRLKENSPAINAGNNDYLNNGTPDDTSDDVTTDLAGDARIQGGTADLGAYESDTKMAQTIDFMLAGTGTAGDKIALTATATSSLPVTFTSSDEAVAAIGTGADAGMLVLKTEGTAIITASQSGNDAYEVAPPVTQMIMVSKQTQTITFTLATTGTAGDKIALTATAESGLEVTFTSSDEAVATIGTGADAGMLVLKTEGSAIITASQSGNDAYEAAPPVPQTIMVSKQAQTIAFTLAATGMVNTEIDLTAMASSSLPVSYASSDEAVAAIGTGTDAGKLVLKAPGTATITASQSGDDAYEAAPPVTQTIDVEAVLGLEETADGFVLYPNPTSGKLHFSERVAEFRLYGIEGRLLETSKNVRSVDLSARPSGMYFVEVVRGERSLRWRVVRE